MTEQLLAKKAMADRLSCSPRQMSNYVKLGCPRVRVPGSKHKYMYDPVAVLRWYIGYEAKKSPRLAVQPPERKKPGRRGVRKTDLTALGAPAG